MKTSSNELCCQLNPLAYCLKCSWKICDPCWNSWAIQPGLSRDDLMVNAIHNRVMKGRCKMKEDCIRGKDFGRTDIKD